MAKSAGVDPSSRRNRSDKSVLCDGSLGSRNGIEPCPELSGDWKFRSEERGTLTEDKILEIHLDLKGNAVKEWVDIVPLPKEDGWFENIWNAFLRDEMF